MCYAPVPDSELDSAFPTLAELRVGGLVISSDAFFYTRTAELAALARATRCQRSSDFASSPQLGAPGLWAVAADAFRQVGIYTGRVLKGEKPADLPVVQFTKVQLVINLKTAKALSLTVPDKLLSTADEVIQ